MLHPLTRYLLNATLLKPPQREFATLADVYLLFGRTALVWRCGEALCVQLKYCAMALRDRVHDRVLERVLRVV